MLKNKEILDKFGEVLIKTAYNLNLEIMEKNIEKNITEKELSKKISFIFKENLEAVFFDFLKIFEENDEFKLYYEKNNQKINLVEISEMFNAEILTEDGWIERFGKELKKEE
jgi:hypothetical protein